MATGPALPASGETDPKEIRLYSHSPIFYWWPVWLVGFVAAFVTYLDGTHMALVPPGTEARRDWVVGVAPGERATREGLILPQSEPGRPYHLPPERAGNAGAPLPAPEQPHVHMARSQYLGTIFAITFLVVFLSSNVPLRGLWEWVAVLAIGMAIIIVALLGGGGGAWGSGSACSTSTSTWPATCSSRRGCLPCGP
jgi:hypothetical protein